MQDAECRMQILTHSQERADRVPMQDAGAECKNSPNIGRRGQRKESYGMHNAGAECIIPPKSALCAERVCMVQMLSMQTACCMLHVSLGATDGVANDSQQPGKRIRSRVKYPEDCRRTARPGCLQPTRYLTPAAPQCRLAASPQSSLPRPGPSHLETHRRAACAGTTDRSGGARGRARVFVLL